MNIDKIFVINLKHRLDRKEQILKELEIQNITNYEFFNGVQATENDILKWNSNYCISKSSCFSDPGKFLLYQIGSFGCLQSHIEICKIALERDYKNILILEDDTKFIKNIEFLYKYSKQINNNYDMLYLCGTHDGIREKVTENIMKTRNTLTTHSYLITKPVMEFLIKNINSYSEEIDVFYVTEVQSKFNCFCTYPHITTQTAGFSDIRQEIVSYEFES